MIPEITLDEGQVRILSAGVALLAAVAFWYLIGKGYLGHDDDFWSPLRHWLLPKLEPYVAKAFGGYTTGTQHEGRAVALVYTDPDVVETVLHRAGFVKGPLAAAKSHPAYGESYASWHFREVQRPLLRAVLDVLERLPIAGDVLYTVENVVALRQVHARLYVNANGDTAVYADEEWNAMNPLTAYFHYRGGNGGRILGALGWSMPAHRSQIGKERVRTILRDAALSMKPATGT